MVLRVWSLSAGKLAYSIPAASFAGDSAGDSAADSADDSAVWSVAISPDESMFVSSGSEGKIRAWNLSSGEQRYQIDNGGASVVGCDRAGWSVIGERQ